VLRPSPATERRPTRTIAWLVVAFAVASSGCLPALQLNRTVMAYDAIATDALCRQLILNIARARHDEPLHFTALSNIAATFNLQLNAGATPARRHRRRRGSLSPIFGAAGPTIRRSASSGRR
jgi:hypothetical protein